MLCDCVRHNLNIYYASNTLSFDAYVYVLMGLSILFDGVSVVYIYKFKGLHAHPMRMFMWLSIASFSFIWLSLISSFTCQLRLNKVFHFTSIFGLLNNNSEFRSMEILLFMVPF